MYLQVVSYLIGLDMNMTCILGDLSGYLTKFSNCFSLAKSLAASRWLVTRLRRQWKLSSTEDIVVVKLFVICIDWTACVLEKAILQWIWEISVVKVIFSYTFQMQIVIWLQIRYSISTYKLKKPGMEFLLV